MPRYCRICDRSRANEKFSGRGHRNLICRDCQRLPKSAREAIEAGLEIGGFLLDQSLISEKNLARLRLHCSSPDPDIVRMAGAVLSAALFFPFRRKRLVKLKSDHPELFAELVDIGLVDEFTEAGFWGDLADDDFSGTDDDDNIEF